MPVSPSELQRHGPSEADITRGNEVFQQARIEAQAKRAEQSLAEDGFIPVNSDSRLGEALRPLLKGWGRKAILPVVTVFGLLATACGPGAASEALPTPIPIVESTQTLPPKEVYLPKVDKPDATSTVPPPTETPRPTTVEPTPIPEQYKNELIEMIGVPTIKNGKEVYPPGSIIAIFQSINVRDIYTSSRWLGEGQQRDEWIALLETEVKLAIETGDFNTARVVIEKLIKDITILESTAFDNNKPLDKNGDKGGFIKGTGLVDAWEEPVDQLKVLLTGVTPGK